MPVVDASVLVEYLAGAEHAVLARAALLAEPDRLWAPHLVDAEVGNVLCRGAAAGVLGGDRAAIALQELTELPIRRVSHLGLVARAFALRGNLSFSDALYVALAERLQMTLITFDGRLARAAASSVTVRVPSPGS